jgi:hypothetical protein
MRALEVAKALEGFSGRGAGTDAERRAAKWLARELEHGGREVAIEQFWGRPNWPLAHAWHVALALAGSLVEVSSPRTGGAMLLAALVFVLSDMFTGHSPGRWLTRQRASQNVVALPAPDRRSDTASLRLILTANYDAGRAGLPFRDRLRGPVAVIRKRARAFVPGWLGWLAIATVWLLIVAIVRLQGHHSSGIGVIQLPPTIGLVLGLALLLDLATSELAPAAGDNGTGVGVAVELARVLHATPPRNIEVEVVLTGASDREGLGLRRYLKTHAGVISPANTAVIGIAACTAGRPCWWRSEGPLIPRRPAPRLRALAARVAQSEPDLAVIAHDDRSATPALPALTARIPAIAIGAVEDPGIVPRSHQKGDTADAIDHEAVERVVELGLTLVDAIDSAMGERRRSDAATPA